MQADKHNVVNAQVEAYVMTQRLYLQWSRQRNYLAGHHERVRDKVCALAKQTHTLDIALLYMVGGGSLFNNATTEVLLMQNGLEKRLFENFTHSAIAYIKVVEKITTINFY